MERLQRRRPDSLSPVRSGRQTSRPPGGWGLGTAKQILSVYRNRCYLLEMVEQVNSPSRPQFLAAHRPRPAAASGATSTTGDEHARRSNAASRAVSAAICAHRKRNRLKTLETARGQLLQKVGLDLRSTPGRLGIGAACAWDRRPRPVGERGLMTSRGEGPAAPASQSSGSPSGRQAAHRVDSCGFSDASYLPETRRSHGSRTRAAASSRRLSTPG
jgi:hypothetical protein